MRDPRGIRNNNPLNIEYSKGNNWVGQTGSDGRFATFSAPAYGYRAALKTLKTYREKYGLKTLREMITRWAPPGENDTELYIRTVEGLSGIDAEEEPDLTDREEAVALLAAMAHVECGVLPAYPAIEEAWAMVFPTQRLPL